jgi:hypothetical protein
MPRNTFRRLNTVYAVQTEYNTELEISPEPEEPESPENDNPEFLEIH